MAAWQAPLERLCGGRVMRGEMLHVTLAFLGAVEQARLEALQLAAQEVVASRFVLRFDRACYWGHNHIVYAAPSRVPQGLGQLVDALLERLATHRFAFDAREHKAHVTLLRNARCHDVPIPQMDPVYWEVRDFALVQSVNQHGLSEYRVLARIPLGFPGG